MKSRPYLWLVVAALAAILVPLDVATGSTPGTPLSCIGWSTRASSTSTSSTAWSNVPAMTVTATLAQNFAVEASGTFTGAGVKLRLMDTSIGGTFPLDPGVTSFRPPSGDVQPFSFTWVGTNPSQHEHTFHLQWRKRSSGPGTATMKAGALALFYQGAPPSTC